MENAQTILVIMLSTFLAIFLIVGIAVLLKVKELLEHLKNITEKAERIADKAENIGQFFKFTAGPVAITKLLSNIIGVVHKHNKTRSSKHE